MSRSYIIAGIITVAAVAWIASGQIGGGKAADASAGAQPEPVVQAPVVPAVRVARLSAEPMANEVVLQGRTQSERSVELKNEVRGRVEAVLAERGSRVKEGDAIVRLAVEGRQHALVQAKTLVAQRQIEYDAAAKLTSKGFNSEIELAQARTNLDAARAAFRQAELDLAHTVITAPFAGVLDTRPVNVGDYLDIGKPVATVVDLDPIRVVGFVSERQVAQLGVGGIGHALILDTVERDGRISYISATADPATRTFRARSTCRTPTTASSTG